MATKRRKGEPYDFADELRPIEELRGFELALKELLPGSVSFPIPGVSFHAVEDSGSPGTGVLLCLVPASDVAPHMATARGLHSYYRRVGSSFIPMEHYEIADLFGRRPRPVLALEFQTRLVPNMAQGFRGQNRVDVKVMLKNVGKAIARFPCVSVKGYEGWPLSEETRNVISRGHAMYPTVRAPAGWKHRFAAGADSVLYPGDTVQVIILALSCAPDNKRLPDLKITVEAVSAEAASIKEDLIWEWEGLVKELGTAWELKGQGGSPDKEWRRMPAGRPRSVPSGPLRHGQATNPSE